MGTNYYHRTNICTTCHRFDSVHIGKSSAGWTFSFHGERDQNPDYNELGGVVASLDDWKRRIEELDGMIYDEYGEAITVEKFLALVESKRDSKLNHKTYCDELHPSFAGRNWLDGEGHSFSEGEFS